MLGFRDGKKAKEQDLRIKDQLKKLPKEQQDQVKETSRIIESTMNLVFDGISSGEAFDLHNKLKQFFKTHDLRDTDLAREVFWSEMSKTKPDNYFQFQGKLFRVSSDKMITGVGDYIYTLEKAVVQKEEDFRSNLCTFLSFSDIFKLSIAKIKRLFRRTNG